MKKQFYVLAMMFLAVSFILPSCNHDDDPVMEYEFSVSNEDKVLTTTSLGQNFSVNVISTLNGTRIGFEIVSFPEWAVAEINLASLSVEVSENLLREGRTGKVIIKQVESGKTIEIQIEQGEVKDKANLESQFAVKTYKIKVISPEITGYEKAPEYKWYEVAEDGKESLLAETKDLAFIRENARKYKLKFHIKDGNVEETLYTEVTVSGPETPYSEKIAKVYEYTPAPGWRVSSYGNAGSTKEMVIETVENRLAADQFVSLGDFGGYIIFGFDHTVINKPDLRDFRITSSTGKTNNTRPGVIMVSYDTNGNGEADDEWYEIAGSEYHHVQTVRGIDITYYKPTEPLENFQMGDNYLKWTTNKEEEGYITKKMIPDASPVYPLWYRGNQEEQITFKNLTKLRSTIVMNGMFPDQSSDANYKPFDYGYACNVGDANKVGTSIDIAWAVDGDGKYVNLPGIDFVKVYTGTFIERGMYYGEADSDIKNAYDLHMIGETIETIKP
ncbi:hypothetical protein [Proteiniphilum sp.]|uniref:hypothetical protein n=1 Tax=Proteiniphilum sp. TaxID=1926877 RepID=UPI002B216B24|nr:hypothetical protein [Proteiniphilum sp.]MEA4918743.1 hypothetical protein [Proteiniphilum sp.]